MPQSKYKEYLGDSVYAEFAGMLKLTTNNGGEDSNTIYLDAEVYTALEAFVRRVEREQEKENSGG